MRHEAPAAQGKRRLHRAGQGDRPAAGPALLVPLPSRQQTAVRSARSRPPPPAAPTRPSASPGRATRTRRRPSGRPRPTGTPARSSPAWPPSATTSTSTSATRSTPTPRSPGSRAGRAHGPGEVGQVPAEHGRCRTCSACASRRPLRPLGRPRVRQRLLPAESVFTSAGTRSPTRTATPSTRRAPRRSATTSRSPTQPATGSTGPSAGGATSRSSSSTSARSAARRPRPTASATTRRPASPTSRPPRRADKRGALRGPRALARRAGARRSAWPRSTTPAAPCWARAQLARFESAVKRSKATFKVVMNEMPIKQFYALPYDRWEGYEAERQKLLTFLRDNVKNVVFLDHRRARHAGNGRPAEDLRGGRPAGQRHPRGLHRPRGHRATSRWRSTDATGNAGGAAGPAQCLPQARAAQRHRDALREHRHVLLRRGDGHPPRSSRSPRRTSTASRSRTATPPCGPFTLDKK